MAVIKVKAEKVVNFFLGMLERELVGPMLVTRVGDDFFKGALNDTVTMRIPGLVATARDYQFRGRTAPIVLDDIAGGAGIPIKLDTHTYSATGLEDEHMTLDEIDFANEVLAPQVAAVTDRFEAKVVAGLRTAMVKNTVPYNLDATDPHLAALEAKRLMDQDKVAPRQGRTFLVGSDVAAAMLASDRLSKYINTGEEGTPAVREAVIGRLAGSPVVEVPGLNPNEAYYLHKSGLVLGSVAPVIPRGVTMGSKGSRNGFAVRWIADYDANYLRDRSIVSAFIGINDVRDERNADGTLKVDDPDGPDNIANNADDAAARRRNVRIVKFTVTGNGSVLA